MNSIRGRLILCLVGGVILLEAAAGAGLFAYVKETLEHSLDAALLAKAGGIAGAVHMEDGTPRLDLSAGELAEPAHHDGPFYFQIWRADGSTMTRIGPAGSSEPLSRLNNSHKRFGDVFLPGGTSARAVELNFSASPDQDDGNSHSVAPAAPKEILTLVVAHDRRSIDQPVAVLLTGLLIIALIITVGIVVLVTWGVGRGLQPLVDLGAQVEQIGPATMQIRCPVEGLPHEIRPITEKLNNFLERLEQAFVRERRFSADVAHELRTPLAELRSLCEVSLRWPEGNTSETVSESLAIAKQMEETVGSLLALVRIQAGVQVARREEVELNELIDSIWKRFEQAAETKGLRVEHHIGPNIILRTDRGILTQALRNLLANAIQHTPQGGSVVIETLRTPKDATILVRNSNVSLTADDIPHLCEPFWRKDSARTDHLSSGLGLTIVDEYCRAIGAALELKLVDQAWFEVCIKASGAIVAPDAAELSKHDMVEIGTVRQER